MIVFPAVVFKVQTLVDGGVRVTLDLAEDCIPQMAMLAEARRDGISLIFEAKTEEETNKREGNVNGRRNRS
jgi:hypothetical protein